MKIEEIRIDEISNHEKNPKIHPENQIRLIEKSMKRFGWTNPVLLSADGVILAGHARVKAAIEQGMDTVPCIRTKLSGKEADAYLLADNRLSDIAPYDRDILAELLADIPSDLQELTGFDTVQVDALLSGEDIPDIEKFISDSQPEEGREETDRDYNDYTPEKLADKFGVPPFSVLNARDGWWQERKRAWISLGIKSELGRGGNILYNSESASHIDYYKKKRAVL